MNKKWFSETSLALKAVSLGAELIEDNKPDKIAKLDQEIKNQMTKVLKVAGYPINKNYPLAGKGPLWLINPLEAVSVGLLVNFRFIIGVVAIPLQKEIFFTLGEQGSFINGQTLKKVCPVRLKESLIAVHFSEETRGPFSRKKEFEVFGVLNDQSRGCLNLGSATVNICKVAAGRLQAAYGIRGKIGEIAGALAIALQAGCRLYLGWHQGSMKINYVVGAPRAADELAQLLSSKKMIKLENYEAKSI